jgi:hypothetical protein
MSDAIHRFYSDFLTVITESTTLFVVIILIFYYAYNRKKYYEVSHKVPARLVREHLNTIIQNSNALKSSLFNEKDLSDTPDLEEVSGAPAKVVSQDALAALQKEKEELENELNVLRESISSDEVPADMSEVLKERDDLLDAISDYKLLEDDLVNLKKLKEENKELKAKLGGEAPSEEAEKEEVEAVEEIAEEAKEPAEEELKAEAKEEVKETKELSPEEKSAEDLLKEFEKMLGQ